MKKTIGQFEAEREYYGDAVRCNGCNELFFSVLENPSYPNHKFCGICYGHVIGIFNYEEINKKLSSINKVAWNIPIRKLSYDLRKNLNFNDKDYEREIVPERFEKKNE